MWKEASQLVESVFFKDSISLYKIGFTENELGEDIESLVLVGIYDCNIENGQSTTTDQISGQSAPQSLRISTVKGIPLQYDNTYKLKIKSARIAFSTTEEWKVDGWTESQLSTVISASREVAV